MNLHRSAQPAHRFPPTDIATEESGLLSYANLFVLMASLLVLALLLHRGETVPVSPLPKAAAEPHDLLEQVVQLPAPSAGNEVATDTPEWLTTFRRTIKQAHLEHLITIVEKPEVTELSIASRVLFEAGEAGLTRSGLEVLTELLPAITQTSGMVYIEGHTDNLPIFEEPYASNWELAAARAAEVMKFFVAQGMDDTRFRAVSFADTQPLVPNTNERNRQQNRRINLVIHRHMTR